MLEHGWSVGRPFGADLVFEVALSASECNFSLVAFLDPDLMVSIAEVDLGEDLRAVEAVEHFRYEGEGVAVLDCHFAEAAIVHY